MLYTYQNIENENNDLKEIYHKKNTELMKKKKKLIETKIEMKMFEKKAHKLDLENRELKNKLECMKSPKAFINLDFWAKIILVYNYVIKFIYKSF